MATYLLTWNPAKWPWPDLQECIGAIERRGRYDDRWGGGVTKKIISGDRVFLMKVGREPRGLVGAGWATSNVYEAPPWESRHTDHPDGRGRAAGGGLGAVRQASQVNHR